MFLPLNQSTTWRYIQYEGLQKKSDEKVRIFCWMLDALEFVLVNCVTDEDPGGNCARTSQRPDKSILTEYLCPET